MPACGRRPFAAGPPGGVRPAVPFGLADVTGAAWPGCPADAGTPDGASCPAGRRPEEPGGAAGAVNKGGSTDVAAGDVDIPAERLGSSMLGNTTGVYCGSAAVFCPAERLPAEPGGDTDAAGHTPFGNLP